MFDSLDDELKRNEQEVSTPAQKWVHYAVVLLAATVLFGGLYAGFRFLEG